MELLPVGRARPQNKKFVKAFKAYAKKSNLPGGDKRVTDDPMEAAYFGVYIWKQAVEKAKSFEVDAVRKAVYGQEFAAPGGKIKMHEANHHTYSPVLIGEILKDGQFKIVSRTKGNVEGRAVEQVHEPGQGLRLGQASGHVSEEGLMKADGSLLLLFVAWLAAPAASHAQSPDALKALADLAIDDADKREAAVTALGSTRDPKWLEFLGALRDGNVYARDAGKAVDRGRRREVSEGDKRAIRTWSRSPRPTTASRSATVPLASLDRDRAPTGACASSSSRSRRRRDAGAAREPDAGRAAAPR